MNRVTLAGHTIDESILPKAPSVLDVGCRGCDFITAILEIRPEANIIGLDPGEMSAGLRPGEAYRVAPYRVLPIALVGDDRKEARYCEYSTGEGNFLTDLLEYYDATFRTVRCRNIATVLEMFGVDVLDVLKLDCEGSEYEIISAMKRAPAKQISVEFHDSGYTPGFGQEHTYKAVRWLQALGYEIIQHEITQLGAGVGHWDSLLTYGA